MRPIGSSFPICCSLLRACEPIRILLVVSLFFFLLSNASGEEIRVGPNGDYPSIAQAISAAQDGDSLIVATGEYRENLIIDKPIILKGEDFPRIQGSGQGDVILVLADRVTVTGFEVRGSGNNMMVSDAGIKLKGAAARILANRLEDNLFGVYLHGAREALVENNRIQGRAEMELGRRGAGIHLYDAHRNTVRSNTVSHVRDGVYFDHSDFNTVEDNHFSQLRYGVHYMYCEDNSFFRNTFRDSIAGVAVMYTERVTFRDNQILHNRKGFNSFGLLLKECNDSLAERNLILGNVRGIFLDSSHRNRFSHNLVAYNDVGVELYASSLQNSFTANDFVGNLRTLHTVGKAKADWTPLGIGNYFADYSGYDLDGDGKGDIRYRLQDTFEYLEGRRPLLRLFLNSAAADALAAAEKSFPLVPSSDQQDQSPSMRPVSGVRLEQPSAGGEGFGTMLAISLTSLLAGGWVFGRLSR